MTAFDKNNYANTVDFGDGVPGLNFGNVTTATTAPAKTKNAHNKATTKAHKAHKAKTNKALCGFGLTVTVLGQAVLALLIAAGGNALVGVTCAVGLAGFGLAFAFAGTGFATGLDHDE